MSNELDLTYGEISAGLIEAISLMNETWARVK